MPASSERAQGVVRGRAAAVGCPAPRARRASQPGWPSASSTLLHARQRRRARQPRAPASSGATCSRTRRGAAARPTTSATVPSATTRPRFRISTREQFSSTSSRRCVLSSTAAPRSARDRADDGEHLALPGRVEAERRLVEEDGPRVVDERARDAEALPHAPAVGRDRRSAALGSPTSSSSERAISPARPRG